MYHTDTQTDRHTHRQTDMMYMLLHRVDAVRAFILSRANIDHLVCTTQTHRHRDRQTDTQTDTQTHTQTDRQT